MKMVQQKKRWVTGGVKRLLSCMLMVAMLFGMAPGAMEVKAEEPSLKEYNKPNPSYSFTTIDDQIVTSTADGKPKVLIFFSTKCGYSRQTISNIANSDYDFSGVDIIAPEINLADKEALTTFKTKYGSDAITFAYSIDGENTEAAWKYAEGGGTMPFIAYIDSSNQLRCVTKGALSAETFIANIEKYCMSNSGGNTDGSTGGDNNSGNTDSSESTSNLFYSFITIDDQIVTSKANGKPKVLIFFSTKCGYSRQTISNIANSKYDFSSVDIIAPEMNFADKEAVTAFKNTYGSDAITFSYSIDGENYTAAMKYSEGGGTMPFIAYIDSNKYSR